MAVSKKSWLAVAMEAVSGTAATTPTVYYPAKAVLKHKKARVYPDEERGTRDTNYDAIDTVRHGEVDPKGNWYMDTSPYFLIAAMGQDTVTQPDAAHAATVYKHTLALADVPPTMTVFKSYQHTVYYTAYSAVQKFTLKWTADKTLEFEPTCYGLWPTKYTGTPLTPTFSTVKALAGYSPTLTLGGTSTNDIDEMTLTFEQKVTAWFASAGTQDFVKLYFGGRTLKVDFTARFDSETQQFQDYQSGTDESLVIDFRGPLIVNSGASGVPPNTNYYQELSLTVPTLSFDDAEPDLGKDNILLKVKGTARAAGSNPLLSGFVQNTVASYAS